jgi:hypothetical protein
MKTLSELSNDLKELMLSLQSDAHHKMTIRPERYNNLKISMDIAANSNPHFIVSISMSAAEFDLKTGEKISGGLGPDERYVLRWLDKPNTLEELRACWQIIEKHRGKATDPDV